MKNKGFSLIELMIVIAIIGIISAIAYPSYTSYITRGKRTECRSAVMQTMQQQERYYTQQNVYLAYTSAATGVPMKQFSGESLASSACTISAAAACAGTPTLTLSACVLVTGTPAFSDPVVGNITLQSDGVKACSGTTFATKPEKCWSN